MTWYLVASSIIVAPLFLLAVGHWWQQNKGVHDSAASVTRMGIFTAILAWLPPIIYLYLRLFTRSMTTALFVWGAGGSESFSRSSLWFVACVGEGGCASRWRRFLLGRSCTLSCCCARMLSGIEALRPTGITDVTRPLHVLRGFDRNRDISTVSYGMISNTDPKVVLLSPEVVP